MLTIMTNRPAAALTTLATGITLALGMAVAPATAAAQEVAETAPRAQEQARGALGYLTLPTPRGTVAATRDNQDVTEGYSVITGIPGGDDDLRQTRVFSRTIAPNGRDLDGTRGFGRLDR